MSIVRRVGVVTVAMGLAACSSPRVKSDWPRAVAPSPSIEPRIEPLRPANARPYTVLGRTYYPMTDFEPFWEEGVASWYGREFHGKPTASGEPYNMFSFTAAHKILPIPSYARVTNLANGRQIVVRVNDRGPFVADRVIDLSFAAADALGFANQGTTRVRVELLLPEEIAAMQKGATRPQTVAEAAATAPPQREVAATQRGRDAAAEPKANGVSSESALATARVFPEAAPAAVASEAVEGGNGTVFYLQLGAFAQAENAENFATHLRAQLPSLPVRLFSAGAMVRVVAGPFRDVTLAQLAADQVVAQLGGRPLVVSARALGVRP
ncbi:septal ring lytic transglycosylase RlpA family protein [Hydrogenophilus thiooxidans]|uniref:septal ring lytic transglycosylase RlpA family protein n=1 Tax=Hydrogenophilus thiooxidans TaxID=2820326 RepID=UPI001C221346|nr:septal ring lytic transglycosylase RlpA family protein [Hydrogenophilus thiooxidans]